MKLESIMLIDDNDDDNFFHEREIKKMNKTVVVIARNSGETALEHLKTKSAPCCDLIFLDLNMPGMNGWDFLGNLHELDSEAKNAVIIIMLTTSSNPDDIAKAKSFDSVSEYVTKPLTQKKMEAIVSQYFA